MTRKIVATFFGDIAWNRRRKGHREFVGEDRIGRTQVENDCPRVRSLDSAEVRGAMRDEIWRAIDAAVILHALRAGGGIEHEFDAEAEVFTGYRSAGGEARVMAQAECEDSSVGSACD